MPVTLTIKAPDKLAAKLRLLAEVNRRSLEDELMAIIRSAATSKRSVGAGRRLTLKEAWEISRKLDPSSTAESTQIIRSMRDERYGD